jgi:uncharacterized protein YhbP (UPF0306 family)
MDVEKIVREFIEKTVHMSLATSADNKPWVCEVHFAYDDDLNLYWRSKKSRRHSQELLANPNVAGNIVQQFNTGDSVVGIYFEGTAEELSDVDAEHPAFRAFKSRFGLNESVLEVSDEPDPDTFYKITVENWYAFGRFGADHGQKLRLEWKM